MKIQDYYRNDARITNKKRKLYKKYLNLGISGIDPTAKDIKPIVTRKGKPPKEIQKYMLSTNDILPGAKEGCGADSKPQQASGRKHFK